jgi:hypothetical protein
MKRMRIVVPIVLSLVATALAIVLTRIIRGEDIDGDFEPLVDEWAAAPIG